MHEIEVLHSQAQEIKELDNVLTKLLSDRSLCDADTTCELFLRYVDAVKHHLRNTESGIFGQLLVNTDDQTCKIVEQFMEGAHEIKLIFSKYSKKWCDHNSLKIKDYEEFLSDTSDVFNLVLRRLQDETENLYPLVESRQSQVNLTQSAQVA